ncbi:MAG: class I SAM-dependent methyltransferase [Gemmataceae bacterium]|nr:class I SAM-dependent methyltransferase [Gemmataceae bacterium]
MEVLRDKTEIRQARAALKKLGASSLDGMLPRLLNKIGLLNRILFVDEAKSWDILKTVEFLSSKITKSDPVLDIGCYASEILIALKKLGYSNLAGVDLDKSIEEMPYNDEIRYVVSDFMETPFADGSFRVVTSISVIEHGLNTAALFSEVSRLLAANGYFIASFDYWPDKINTDNIKFFHMDWTIFSREEVVALVAEAERFSLRPLGVVNPPVKDRTVFCASKSYTFAWMVFQKMHFEPSPE